MPGEQLFQSMSEGEVPQAEITDADVQRLLDEDRAVKVVQNDARRWHEGKAKTIGWAAHEYGAERAADSGESGQDPFDNTAAEEQRRIMNDPMLEDIRGGENNVKYYENQLKKYNRELAELESLTSPKEIAKYLNEIIRLPEMRQKLNALLKENNESGLSELKQLQIAELRETIAKLEDRFREAIKEGVPKTKAAAAEELRLVNVDRGEVLKDYENSFEKFYELNPEAFNQMPTSEFVAAYKELQAIEQESRVSSELLGDLTSRSNLKAPAEALVNEMPLLDQDVKSLVWVIERDLPGEDATGLVEKIRNAYENGRFDKTPRQIAEALKAIADEVVELARKRLETAEQRKQEFMAKYASQSEQSTA